MFLSWFLLALRWALPSVIEGAVCLETSRQHYALRGVKVPIQDGTLDEERSAALTLSRWQVRDLQHLHYEIQSYLGLRDIGPIRETEDADPHVPKPLAAPAAEFERLSARYQSVASVR